ncbi:MAG TPA: type II secretion system protein [Candidatus Paceibacterota bacterium]|nr:type II secretion system protein [Candidatus Paceibacterota bacterium]
MYPRKGFTMLELLLVVAAIGILAGLVITALNPGARVTETRNSRRRVDVNIILNAVYQFALDNNGALPSGIPTTSDCPGTAGNEICRTGASSCSGLLALTELTDDDRYLVELPVDPSAASGSDGTGYRISRSSTGRVTVCAPEAEDGEVITVTR